MSSRFYDIDPSLENCWRAVVLLGRNEASYKFALAKALLELAEKQPNFVLLEDLAEPFSRYIVEHVKSGNKQGKNPGKFLNTCKEYHQGKINHDELIKVTSKLGFQNVIDAFHNVNNAEVPHRFFADERNGRNKGIRLTDNLFKLYGLHSSGNFGPEVESRWRLVETGWELNIPASLISVEHNLEEDRLFFSDENRRINITSVRDLLNGYQKGRCFYCFQDISIISGSSQLADVDHFHPWSLKKRGVGANLDGVWNLVLACVDCNRGNAGKFAKVPSHNLLDRLHVRNEYFISDKHQLMEILIEQTGKTMRKRAAFLQGIHNEAIAELIHTWEPTAKADPTF